MLFHQLGLDYTWSTYAAEGGNFGLFTSHEIGQASECQDLCRGQEAWCQIHPGRRVRPYVAGREPVYGHHERSRRISWKRRSPPLRAPGLTMPPPPRLVHICEFTADLLLNAQSSPSIRGATTISGSRFMIPATLPGAWGCSMSRAIFSERPATISMRCLKKPSGSTPSAAAAGPGFMPRKTWSCACEAVLPGPMLSARTGQTPSQHAGLHLCHRPDGPSATHGVLGPGSGRGRGPRAPGNALIMDGEKERTTDMRGEDLPEQGPGRRNDPAKGKPSDV